MKYVDAIILNLFSILTFVLAQPLQWSFQSFLQVPEAGANYGMSPTELVGRGFQTLISGYDDGDSGEVSSNGTTIVQPRAPGIYIHTTDTGYAGRGYFVWTQQAKLVAKDAKPGDNFGRWMVFDKNYTIIVSSPYAENNRGFLYVFNGTLRHWSQVQKLLPADIGSGGYFGDYMALQQNRMVIGAKGVLGNSGAAYVYEREQGGVYWSRHSKLVARDFGANNNFGAKLALYGDTTVITASNDDLPGLQSGSAYVFSGSSGLWSQQQKLIAIDFEYYREGKTAKLDLTFGNRTLGRTVAMNKDNFALGITNGDPGKPNRESVYIYQGSSANRWSLQQKLFAVNDSTTQLAYGADVLMDQNNTLIATIPGPVTANSYIFKTFGNGWSLQQVLNAFTPSQLGLTTSSGSSSGKDDDYEVFGYHPTSYFRNVGLSGGNLFYGSYGSVQIQSEFSNSSCLIIWLSDHFLDGWDTAVLTVRAPDLTNDTFHPHCDQVDPFQVRYCPYQPQDEGVYIIKVFAPSKARFSWEISWRVQEESTGKWYLGDFSTTMHFQYNWNASTFQLVYSENLIDLDAPCYRCETISTTTWVGLQRTGNNAFWPLVAYGAPYYISDSQARLVYSSGKVCSGVSTFECYQSLNDGVYILRLGGGLFGDLTGFPYHGANWFGCGANGTNRHQLIFQIKGGKCEPLQVFHYTSRCAHPPDLDLALYSDTAQPTFGGSAAPVQSVFGNVYKKSQMYSIEVPLDGQHQDPNPTLSDRQAEGVAMDRAVFESSGKLQSKAQQSQNRKRNLDEILLP